MIDSEFVEFLAELTEPLGGVAMRRMFGGLAVYCEGTVFALVIDGTLYLKANADTIPAFEAEGSGPFTYAGRGGRQVKMPYWRLPERLYDEPDEFLDWCRRSLAAARTMAAGRPPAMKSRQRASL